MARPEQRKARKDYPQNGIKAGDTYWYVKLKMQRGGRVMRSLTPFKPSQLTQSGFKSAWLSAQEGWEASDKDAVAQHESEVEDWQEAHDQYQSEIARIVEEADGLIGEMPE